MGIDVGDMEEPESELNEHQATTRNDPNLALKENGERANLNDKK